MTDPDHDRLRALLEDAVADVQPAPALDRIRSRTKVTPMRHTRPWLLVAAGAVAATAATITVVSLADPRSPQADPGPGPAATTTATPSEGPSEDGSEEPSPTPAPDTSETPSETAAPEPSAEPEPAGGEALPVYFVGDTPAGPRLFREFQRAPSGADADGRSRAALELAVDGTALDPDYGSPWASLSVAVGGVRLDGGGDDGLITVDLGSGVDLAAPPQGMTGAQARLAVQQLVHTAQAVLQSRAPVQFRVEDRETPTLLGVDVAGGIGNDDPLEVLSPVSITTPPDGQRVGRASVLVQGVGAFPEANVSWQLLRPDGTVAEEGFTTAEECCRLAPYAFQFDARPGDYVLRVYAADMSGGEGPGEHEDTKRITVR